ncbi:Chloride channel, voltage gated [Carpediemonas membranifera]|uniref:Chloride channel protein n=1 Tax=Carpediemonas membranifera TaxID=201153 RepID=A0A8J6AWW2_9EUKA|nr:Chloride channel, voltage gated [Carpediemonas membranifera]|eukprot:KAG9396871.1 Chloride channel, voltage gated [Carpediemonas membranifera]
MEENTGFWQRAIVRNRHHHEDHGQLMSKMSKYDSLEYQDTFCAASVAQRHRRSKKDVILFDFSRWMLSFFIGVITALAAVFIDVNVVWMSTMKFNLTSGLIRSTEELGPFFQFLVPFIFFIVFNCGLVATATYFVARIEPCAAGSGIPEIKSYLNGVRIPMVVRLRTAMSKVVGVLFSVAGGLCVGKEGPMIHTGAIVGAGISQGKSIDMPLVHRIPMAFLKPFRNDHEKRDFVSCGAAAGVAAAFGSPTGGALFSLEEASSFFNQGLTWRIFFSSMISTFTLNIVLSGVRGYGWGNLSQPGLITFGMFNKATYTLYQLPLFLLLGAFGGVMGAGFNAANTRISRLRIKYLKGNYKMLEAILIAFITATCQFCLPFIMSGVLNQCVPHRPGVTDQAKQFYCPEGHYSDIATLFYNPQEDAIRSLFHSQYQLSMGGLFLFAVVYYCLAIVTYGVAVPSGLFVPCLLSGAAFGRIYGRLISLVFPGIDTGNFALIGAASMLGGVARMTISLTIILLEATNDIQYGMPIMLTIMTAKLVGDLFNKGLYDIHIHLKAVPFLEFEPPHCMDYLEAGDIMSRDPITIPPVVTVEQVTSLMKLYGHQAFPVVDPVTGKPLGLITVPILTGMLINSIFIKDESEADGSRSTFSTGSALPQHFDWYHFSDSVYPRFPSVDKILSTLTESDLEQRMDIQPFMDPSPHTVRTQTPVIRVFTLLRGLGLRHILVVSDDGTLVGIVSRKDLVEEVAESFLGATKGRDRAQTVADTIPLLP